MENTTMQLLPYLHFEGNCEEALNNYQKIFSGTIDEMKRYDSAPMPTPEDHKNKVLHSTFRFGNNSFMACDAFPGQTVASDGNVVMCLGFEDEAFTQKVFHQLAEGGKITMPLEKQFWGALFGQVTDRFGINWMLNCELA